MFLAEGAPAVILGFILLQVLTYSPTRAKWLSKEEKDIVSNRLGMERKEKEKRDLWQSLLLAASQFTFTIGSYGVAIFLPLIIKQQAFSNLAVGFISALPSLVACIAMIIWAGAVDRSGRKINNLALTNLLSGVGIVVAVYMSSNFPIALLGLTAVVVGTNTSRAILWTIPTRFLSGIGAAKGLALIISVGAIGGFVGPSIMGELKDLTGSFNTGFLALSGFMFVSMILTLCLKLVIKRE